MQLLKIGILMWGVGLGSVAALGGPYEPRYVPADAQWVAQVDIQKAINSQLGQLLLKDFDVIGLQDKLAALQVMIGVNPLVDFEDVTLYGKTFDEKTAVLLVHMRGSLSQLEAIAKTYQKYETTEYKKTRIHSWVEGGKTNRYAGVYVMPGESSMMVISAMNLEMVEKQVDLLEGMGATLGDGKSKLGQPDEEGVFVFASVSGLNELGELAQGIHAEMLRAAESFVVVVAEREGQMSASVKLTAATNEQATAVQQLALGIVAAARLAMPKDIDANIRTLVNRLGITLVNRTVTANISYASAELHGIIKQFYDAQLQQAAQAISPHPANQQQETEAAAPSGDAQPAQQ